MWHSVQIELTDDGKFYRYEKGFVLKSEWKKVLTGIHFPASIKRSHNFSQIKNFSIYQYNATKVMHFSFSLLRIKGSLYVSSITCSSSWGTAQTAFGILLAYNVSWQWHVCSFTASVPHTVLNKLNEKCSTLISLYWYTMIHGQQNIKFRSILIIYRKILNISEAYINHRWIIKYKQIVHKLILCITQFVCSSEALVRKMQRL
jgi:hypothetical protein